MFQLVLISDFLSLQRVKPYVGGRLFVPKENGETFDWKEGGEDEEWANFFHEGKFHYMKDIRIANRRDGHAHRLIFYIALLLVIVLPKSFASEVRNEAYHTLKICNSALNFLMKLLLEC